MTRQPLSEAHKKKLSDARKAWWKANPTYTKPREAVERIAAQLRGRKRPDQAFRMSGDRNPMHGKKVTQVAKDKMVLAHARERKAFLTYMVGAKGKVFHPSSVCDAIEIMSDGSIWLVEFKSPTDHIRPKQALAQKLTPNYKIVKFTEQGEPL